MYRAIVIILVCLLLPQLSGAAQISAQRETEIRSAVVAYVKQKQANFSNDVRLKRFSIAGGPALPEGVLDYEVIAPQQWGGWGNANLAVIARQGDRVIGNINVRADVEVLAEMVFVTRQINMGTVFTVADLVLRKSDVGAIQGRHITSIDDVVGKKARMTLRANVALRSDQIEKIPLVKTGQMVTIVAENERVRITVTGKAKSPGAEGDTIIVQNLSSLKEMPARVVNADVVQIAY